VLLTQLRLIQLVHRQERLLHRLHLVLHHHLILPLPLLHQHRQHSLLLHQHQQHLHQRHHQHQYHHHHLRPLHLNLPQGTTSLIYLVRAAQMASHLPQLQVCHHKELPLNLGTSIESPLVTNTSQSSPPSRNTSSTTNGIGSLYNHFTVCTYKNAQVPI
jgi:hypothetical protein